MCNTTGRSCDPLSGSTCRHEAEDRRVGAETESDGQHREKDESWIPSQNSAGLFVYSDPLSREAIRCESAMIVHDGFTPQADGNTLESAT